MNDTTANDPMLICLMPNISRDTITAEYWETHVPAVAVFMSIFFVVALVWNSFVIYCMLRGRSELLRAPTHVLLFSLAVNDLLVTLFVMPVSIVTAVAEDYPFGGSDYIRCKVCQHGVLFSIFSVSSVHHIGLLSLDRFLYVFIPITYTSKVTRWKMLSAVFGVWVISIVLGILPLFNFGAIGYSSSIGTCVVVFHGETYVTENMNYLLLFFIEALIPITVIVICNIGLLYVARKHLKLRAAKLHKYSSSKECNLNKNHENEIDTKHRKQQLQLLKVFGAIFVGNIITWLPVLGLALASQIVDFHNVSSEAIAFVYMTYISYAVIHPVLESWFIVDIRMMVTRIPCFHFSKNIFIKHFHIIWKMVAGMRS